MFSIEKYKLKHWMSELILSKGVFPTRPHLQGCENPNY
jgi:hypothetical protein